MSSSLPLHHLVFHSQVQIDFTDAQLIVLADRSYAYSQHHHVTGVLLYHTGQFVAVFEGKACVVAEMEQLVRANVRHYNMQVLARGPIPQRSFSAWRMSFVISQPEKNPPPAAGYLALHDPAVLAHLTAPPSPHLLNMLREFVAAVPEPGSMLPGEYQLL